MPSPMTCQCIRQWVRVINNKMYGLNVMEDSIMYMVLYHVVQIIISDVPIEIKTSAQLLGAVMLGKKRYSVDITELENLIKGNIPLPASGKTDTFYSYMKMIADVMDVKYSPMTIWYILCIGLGNTQLMENQLLHCINDIRQDFPDIEPKNLLSVVKITPITYYKINDDYPMPI